MERCSLLTTSSQYTLSGCSQLPEVCTSGLAHSMAAECILETEQLVVQFIGDLAEVQELEDFGELDDALKPAPG